MHSEHFSESELACPHCGVNGVQKPLLVVLEAFRAAVGQPVTVNSAYRCPAHNAAVGGVLNSEHVQGIAADIRVTGMSAAQLYDVAQTIPEITGLGRADVQKYVHIDTRRLPARWCYNAGGAWVSWYPVPATPITEAA
jgi:uncharacterized protein YcbK (DUF882 family)